MTHLSNNKHDQSPSLSAIDVLDQAHSEITHPALSYSMGAV